jgi:hypothetical protein
MLVKGVLAGDDDGAAELGLKPRTPVKLTARPGIKPSRRGGSQPGE